MGQQRGGGASGVLLAKELDCSWRRGYLPQGPPGRVAGLPLALHWAFLEEGTKKQAGAGCWRREISAPSTPDCIPTPRLFHL